jgi:hypothetical protein
MRSAGYVESCCSHSVVPACSQVYFTRMERISITSKLESRIKFMIQASRAWRTLRLHAAATLQASISLPSSTFLLC